MVKLVEVVRINDLNDFEKITPKEHETIKSTYSTTMPKLVKGAYSISSLFYFISITYYSNDNRK